MAEQSSESSPAAQDLRIVLASSAAFSMKAPLYCSSAGFTGTASGCGAVAQEAINIVVAKARNGVSSRFALERLDGRVASRLRVAEFFERGVSPFGVDCIDHSLHEGAQDGVH